MGGGFWFRFVHERESVCVREREGERECVCVREREREGDTSSTIKVRCTVNLWQIISISQVHAIKVFFFPLLLYLFMYMYLCECVCERERGIERACGLHLLWLFVVCVATVRSKHIRVEFNKGLMWWTQSEGDNTCYIYHLLFFSGKILLNKSFIFIFLSIVCNSGSQPYFINVHLSAKTIEPVLLQYLSPKSYKAVTVNCYSKSPTYRPYQHYSLKLRWFFNCIVKLKKMME